MTEPPTAVQRAVTPVVAVVLLIGVTVVAASIVSVGVLTVDLPAESRSVAMTMSVDVDANRVTVSHRGGPDLDVTRLTLFVTVNGEPLQWQPPVPFFAARGFRGGPTGPFNSRSPPRWTAGEDAGVRIAETNDPTITPGSTVAVTVRRDHRVVASLETSASAT